MAPGLPRTRLNSSKFIRFLADLAVAEVADSKQTFAERLGLWLDWTDAIALSAALNSGTAVLPAGKRPAVPAAPAIAEDLARVRADLARSIRSDAVFAMARTGTKLPPAGSATAAGAADFSPYRRQYLAHQRAMAAGIGPLRARVRAALSSSSPALGQLAALDAVLDEALAAREHHLLSKVPTLLEKHFERSRQAHPPAWLDLYGQDMQGALLAELDLRLQPIEGMMEAMGHGMAGQHE